MKIHLVCYADERFRHGQRRLVASAALHGVDVIHAFGPADLRQTDFHALHKDILDQPRGNGYWLWKPYFIREVLRKAAPGDFVLYMDSGAEIVASVAPLVDVCKAAGGALMFANHDRLNRYWTKRDCYVLMECDTEACYDADQLNAAFSGYTSGPDAIAFVDEWLDHCGELRKLTDIPNECGLPDLLDFVSHLHDQSVLSLLAFSHGLRSHRDPSQFGNHMKPPGLRVLGEYLDLPYSRVSCARSSYPTLFNHHRNGGQTTGVASRAASWAKRQIRRWIPKDCPNPFFTPANLADAIRRNRGTLAGVTEWFDPVADAGSRFGYGVPPSARTMLDRPVGSQPTISDLIVHLSDHLGERLNYLEIGVSVGKNFYQLMRAGKLRTLTGWDIEEIHPNLSTRLTRGKQDEWPSSPGSPKGSPASLTVLGDHVGGNRVRYLAGDVSDGACWDRLQGQRFNFIYFDTVARPELLMRQWSMIQRLDLLDRDEFVMIWDDLGGYMSLAFHRIADQAELLAGPCTKLLFPIRGWMGMNEYPHQVGLLAKLRNPPVWLRDAVRASPRVDVMANRGL